MASLIEDLARRLSTSPEQARRHLHKLLLSLRSQAQSGEHATLPGLGTFTQQEDTWTFEPDEALARSVNRSFDDLEPVGVSSQTNPSQTNPAASPAGNEASDSEAPDERYASPSKAEEGGKSASRSSQRQAGTSIFDAQAEGTGEEIPARGLFSPSASETEETPEETDASEAPVAEKPTPPSEKPQAEKAQAEEAPVDWSLPKEEPAPNTPEPRSPSWSYAALPAGYLVRRRPGLDRDALREGRLQPLPDVSSPGPPSRPPEEPPTAASTDAASTDTASTGAASGEAAPDRRPAEPRREPQREPRREQKSRSGSGLRWLGGLLALIVVALGLWYVFASQSGASSEESATATQTEQPEAQASPPPGAAATGAQAASAARRDTASPGAQAYADAPRLDRAQGGWTVVVASDTSREAARHTAQQFAQRFQEQSYPLDIAETTIDGTRRFRVLVGQFPSSDQAVQVLQQGADRFPKDAWPLKLKPGA